MRKRLKIEGPLQMGDNDGMVSPQMELWTPPPSNLCQMTFNTFPAADLIRSQTSHSSSDWYFEMVFNAAADITKVGVGIDDNTESLTQAAGRAGGICWLGNGTVNYNGTANVYSAPTFSVGDVLRVNPKLTAGTIGFAVNGGSFTTVSISAIVGGAMFALAQLATGFDQVTATFSAPFAFTAPSTAWG